MAFCAAMLEQMKAEGLDLDACIRVLKAGEKKSDPTNAERQARHRAKNNAVTVTDDGFPNDIDILTPSGSPTNSNELASPGLTVEQVVEGWNHHAERWGARQVRKLTPQRRRKIACRIRQFTVDEFTEAIAAIDRSPFLRGENDRGWRADFDWFLEPKNFTKLIEGTYDR